MSLAQQILVQAGVYTSHFYSTSIPVVAPYVTTPELSAVDLYDLEVWGQVLK